MESNFGTGCDILAWTFANEDAMMSDKADEIDSPEYYLNLKNKLKFHLIDTTLAVNRVFPIVSDKGGMYVFYAMSIPAFAMDKIIGLFYRQYCGKMAGFNSRLESLYWNIGFLMERELSQEEKDSIIDPVTGLSWFDPNNPKPKMNEKYIN